MSDLPFLIRRPAALAILAHGEGLSRKAGSFAGQCCVDETPLTPKQLEWFLTLAARAGVEIEQ